MSAQLIRAIFSLPLGNLKPTLIVINISYEISRADYYVKNNDEVYQFSIPNQICILSEV